MAHIPIALLLTLLVIGCATRASEPDQDKPAQARLNSNTTPLPTSEELPAGPIIEAAINPETLYPESLDQMIYRSDLIVRASLVSVTAATEALSGGEGASPTYRPLHELRFTVHEYLKGSGSGEILVVVRPRYHPDSSVSYPRSVSWYSTEAEARDQADWLLTSRNRTWDDRQALLFLNRDTSYGYGGWYDMSKVIPSLRESQPVDTFVFPITESHYRRVFNHTIDTLTRVWLPANSTDVPADIATMEFITDGAVSPQPTISLAAFRSQKAELDATLKAGEGIEGFVGCIVRMLANEQHRRANPDWPVPAAEKTMGSGLAAGTELFRKREEDSRATGYHNYWLSGDDMDLFQAVRIDDDSDPTNGYDDTLETSRPLPAGVYAVEYNRQHYSRIPCDYKPDYPYTTWTVTAIASSGTIHEAFFDPVIVGNAVLADATNGVLKPASITRTDGTPATLTRVSYESGTVKIEVTPDDALAGHLVDFIELEGSVSLALDVAAAMVDTANDTLSWTAASQPWDDGDKLMVRIRRNPASCSGGVVVPNPDSAPGLVKDCEALLWAKDTIAGTGSLNWGEGTAITGWDGVTVGGIPQRVTALGLSSRGLTGRVPSQLGDLEKLSNLDLGSNQLTGEIPSELGGLSSLTRLRLAGNRFTGCVPAALRDVSDHDFDLLGLEYCAPVAPAPEDVSVVLSEGLFTLYWARVDGAERYQVQHLTGEAQGAWTELGAREFTTWTFSPVGGLLCGTTYKFRVQARGDGTTYASEWGEPSASASYATGTCPNRPPVFEKNPYAFPIAENSALDQEVGVVSATDPQDDTVTYTITAGNDDGKFAIDGSTGSITVAGELDHEMESSYTLTVQASDGTNTATAAVEITVTDVIDVAEEDPPTPAHTAAPTTTPRAALHPTPTPRPTFKPTPTVAAGPSYLTQDISPCSPSLGSPVDPCEPDVTPFEVGVALSVPYLGDEPLIMREFLDDEPPPAWVTHIVLRGTYLPGTVRCSTGDLLNPPSYLKNEFVNFADSRAIKCYIDIRANSYVLGTGPATLTVLVLRDPYWDTWLTRDWGEGQTGQDLLEQTMQGFEILIGQYFPGSEQVVFLGPPADLSSEAWRLQAAWDVQRREDDTVIAVHPERDLWRDLRPDDYRTHRSKLEMGLPAFTQAVTEAHQTRVSDYGGRIGADSSLPMLVTDGNRLRQYYSAVGAYETGGVTPVQPPPPCGLVVPDQTDNPGLMRDCIALLAAKDTLRGSAALNWSVNTAIADWDGVTASGTPSRVTKLLLASKSLSGSLPGELGDLSGLTHLNLSSNSHTGEIPKELGRLSKLEEIRLSGNSLTGCIPLGLKDVSTNDLSSLNLLYCPPEPQGLTAVTAGETSVTLSWTAVSGASKYRVEYRLYSGDWIVDDSSLTAISQNVKGLICESEYLFRVSAHGDWATFAAGWSAPSASVVAGTTECISPVFGEDPYAFPIAENSTLETEVGVVSATDPQDDTVTYTITAGNDDGKFAIGASTGSITIAGELDYETTASYTLTVQARNGNAGIATVPVAIDVIDVAEEGPPTPVLSKIHLGSVANQFT